MHNGSVMGKLLAAAGLIMLVGLLFVAQAIAGTPTRASWAAAANHVCASMNAKVRALPKPITPARYLVDIRGTLRIAKQGTRELAQIPAPKSEASTIGKLLAVSRSQNRLVQRQFLPALLAGDVQRAKRIAKQGSRLNTQLNRMARSLAARVCAKNPAPQG
jgi:hypothetical protein